MAITGRKSVGKGKHAAISAAEIRSATGRTWPQWLKALDAAGAEKLRPRQIIELLGRYRISQRWRQAIGEAYDHARDTRKNQRKLDGGLEVGASRTIGVGVETLYAAWVERRLRKRWLTDPDFTVRQKTNDQSMRITWIDGKTEVTVSFRPRGKGKSRVSLRHSHLAGSAEAKRMKSYWAGRLERLKEMLERRSPNRNDRLRA